jgi:crossover junction endodeoxyribonuclease RuvC
MIILGIDTAMRCTGYGIISAEHNNFKTIDCGIIKNHKNLRHSECLKRLSGGIRELINSYSIDVAVIEGAFYGKNVKTTMILGYARGCVMTVLAEADIPIYVYSPKEVKMSAGGSGHASKQQVAVIISAILNIDITNIENDATDALGLALCHANRVSITETKLFFPKQI